MRSFKFPIRFSKFEKATEDGRFINVSIDVLHTGINANGSYLEKQVVDDNAETIKNTPILGFIRKTFDGEKDFKGHEYIITKNDDGKIVEEYLGQAYGVVPESCNYRWETKMCDDGEEREFFVVDGLLWTKFENAAEIMISDMEKSHSMEVYPESVEGYEDEEGVFHFTKFSFDGCCILGDDVEPAMVNSNIKVNFSMSDFIKEVHEEIKTQYSLFSKIKEDGEKENNSQGGKTMSTKKNTDFSQTVVSMLNDIAAIFSAKETLEDEWGWKYARYCLVDIQDDKAIATDAKDNYNYYAFEITMNGDAPEINFESAVRQKVTYTDYEEGETPKDTMIVFANSMNEIKKDCAEKVANAETEYTKVKGEFDDVSAKYEQIKTDYSTVKHDYELLAEKENERIKAETENQKNEMFTKFEALIGEDEEFKKVKDNRDAMTVQDIENSCSVIYTRKSLKTAFSKQTAPNMSLNIAPDVDDDIEEDAATERYGSLD